MWGVGCVAHLVWSNVMLGSIACSVRHVAHSVEHGAWHGVCRACIVQSIESAELQKLRGAEVRRVQNAGRQGQEGLEEGVGVELSHPESGRTLRRIL